VKQEPVAWMYDQAKFGPTDLRGQQWRPALSWLKPHPDDELIRSLTPLYTAPPKQEPVAFECPRCGHCCRPEWVGLTDEEVSEVIDDVLEGGGWLDVARALEAAIKEKNT
jgi:hypothetical protein